MKSPRIGRRRVVYENRYQRIYRIAADFGGFTREYFVTDYGRRAGLVVAQWRSVLLVRQYRMLIDRVSWEIPGGSVDQGETPAEAAVRECLEEAGIRCANLKPLLEFQPGLDSLYNPTYLFHTDQFTTVREAKHDGEVKEHLWVPLERCIQMVFSGQIVDSLSIIALLTYRTLTVGHA